MVSRFLAAVFFLWVNTCLGDTLDLSKQATLLPSLSGEANSVRQLVVTKASGVLQVSLKDLPPLELWLGKIPCDTTTDIALPVENVSLEPLRLIGIDSSCGCIAAMTKELSIEPGGVAKLMLRVKAPKSGEKFRREVYVKFEGPKLVGGGGRKLLISADASPLLSVFPSIYDLAQLTGRGSPQSRVVVSANFHDVDMRKLDIAFSDRLIESFELVKRNKLSSELKVRYIADFADAPFNEWQETISAEYNGKPVCQLPYHLSLRGSFFATPRHIYLQANELPREFRLMVAAKDKTQDPKLNSIVLLCGNDPIERGCEFEERVSSKNISAYNVTIRKLSKNVLDGNLDARMELHVEGQANPIALKIHVSPATK